MGLAALSTAQDHTTDSSCQGWGLAGKEIEGLVIGDGGHHRWWLLVFGLAGREDGFDRWTTHGCLLSPLQEMKAGLGSCKKNGKHA